MMLRGTIPKFRLLASSSLTTKERVRLSVPVSPATWIVRLRTSCVCETEVSDPWVTANSEDWILPDSMSE